MRIVTCKQCFKDVYSSVPKIIISFHERKTFLDVFELEALLSQVDIYELKTDQDEMRLIPLKSSCSESELIPLQLVPNFCLGLVCFFEEGEKEFNKLLNWWQTSGNISSTPGIIKLNSEQAKENVRSEFWQWMYGLLTQQNQALAQRIATLQKQYLGLRTLHENMQNAFAVVEDYLSQAKLPPLQLAFETEATDQVFEPSTVNGSNTMQLTQLLPVPSRGLALIELHIATERPQAVGDLVVKLKHCEENGAIAVWQIPYGHLTQGWFSLDLPSISLGRKRDLELIIEWITRLGPAPALSLSKLQLIPEGQAVTDQGNLERSMAIRLWQGLPGTRKVASPYLTFSSGNHEEVITPQLGYLGQGALSMVKEVTPNLPTDEFNHIQIFPEDAKILTHPRANGSKTIAMLPFSFPMVANHLTASVATEHEAAGEIMYAIAIIDPTTDPMTCLNHENASAFSGWVSVNPNSPRKITLDLDYPLREHSHIVLGTKFAEGSSPDYGWAYWHNFYTDSQKRLLDKSAEGESQKILSDPNQLRDASIPLVDDDFARVQLVDDGGKIQVHPSYQGNTVAILRHILKPGTTGVVSTVCTENEEATNIEYAIAAITEDDDIAARLAIISPQSALGFSGWHSVAGNKPFQLGLDLVVPTVESCHLVLATRIPKGGSQSNAWSRWLNLQILHQT